MKKAALIFWMFLPMSPFLLQANQKIDLSLYFRVIEETHKSLKLNKGSVALLIDNTKREVVNLAKIERSLSNTSDLGRNFILSFHTTKFNKPVEKGISYFVVEILQPNDNLILLTPIKAYRISLSRDKEKVIMDAIRLLKNDCLIYEKKRISAEKGLENEITKLNHSLSNGTEDPGGVQSYKAVYQFLLNYPKNFSQFKLEYLLPHIAKHREIRQFMGERRGDRWWIHIQNRENVRIINKTREVIKKIHQRTTYEGGTLSRTMAKDLSDLENQLIISDSFPQSEFLNTILGANISYNVIFWGSPNSGRSSISSEEKSDLGSTLNQICRYSGGKMVTTTELETGLKKIKNHSDQYYDLTFEFDGILEEKKIRLLPSIENMRFSYKEEYTKEEIEALVRDQLKDTIQINDFSLNRETIRFTLNSFQIDRKEKYGMLKVRIMLCNQQNTPVFQTENLLRAYKESVTVSVPLPEKYQGDFKILISVFDLLANTSTSDERLITLHI